MEREFSQGGPFNLAALVRQRLELNPQASAEFPSLLVGTFSSTSIDWSLYVLVHQKTIAIRKPQL
jgi:hypothetical protein